MFRDSPPEIPVSRGERVVQEQVGPHRREPAGHRGHIDVDEEGEVEAEEVISSSEVTNTAS